MLDPIGLGFILFFAIVMFIQFSGMLLHRVETTKVVLSTATISGSQKDYSDFSQLIQEVSFHDVEADPYLQAQWSTDDIYSENVSSKNTHN